LSPTVAEIHLSALRHNLTEVMHRVGTAAVLAVVKANAYGHGAIHVSKTLLAAGVRRLGVATVAEGMELREAGINAPVLVMGGVFPEELPNLLEHHLTPVLPSLDAVRALASAVNQRSAPLPVHLKVDTGMRRLGLSPEEVRELFGSGWPRALHLEGVMSHLASADDEDTDATERQLKMFRELLDDLKLLGTSVPIAHVANSAGILRFSGSHFDMVRPGLMLYGYSPSQLCTPDLHPVLAWKTRVVQIKAVGAGQPVSYGGTFVTARPTKLAILPVGYADGYHRALSNCGRVLIGGQPVPVVGCVCMDLTMVDVTDHPPVYPGDEVVLLGRQGTATITADDLAACLNTISYEVLSGIGRRVVRVYRED